MKFTAAGVTNCAAMTRSPSFSRSASSTTMTIFPRLRSAMTDSMESKVFFIQPGQRNLSPREFQPIQLAFSPVAFHCANLPLRVLIYVTRFRNASDPHKSAPGKNPPTLPPKNCSGSTGWRTSECCRRASRTKSKTAWSPSRRSWICCWKKIQDAELGEVVRHELRRINAIVTQMLQLAAPGPASFKTVRIHELLDHSLRLLQPQMSVKLIAVEKKLPRRIRHGARR